MITIARMTGVHKAQTLIGRMIEEVRQNRCRSIAPEDVAALKEEVNEEMMNGKTMFKELMDDTIWSMTGERPDKRDWSDMKCNSASHVLK